MPKYILRKNSTGFITEVIVPKDEYGLSFWGATLIATAGITLIILVAIGKLDFLWNGVCRWLELP